MSETDSDTHKEKMKELQNGCRDGAPHGLSRARFVERVR